MKQWESLALTGYEVRERTILSVSSLAAVYSSLQKLQAYARNFETGVSLTLSSSLIRLSLTHHLSNREYTQTYTSPLNTYSSWIKTTEMFK